MRVTITHPLVLSPEQKQIMLLHGPLNLLCVIHGSLTLLTETYGALPAITHALADTAAFTQYLRQFPGDISSAASAYIAELRHHITSWQSEGAGGHAVQGSTESRHCLEMLAMALTRLEIAMGRLVQYLSIDAEKGAGWRRYSVAEITDGVRCFLEDMAAHSRGRYAMKFDGQATSPKEYSVSIAVSSPDDTIQMPEIFWDVIYDLLANARKYTAPGGRLIFALHAGATGLTLIVGDSGRGIPPAEIDRVVEFGYRASNANNATSSIGGFGLTKAYFLCQNYHGTMAICSELGEGTEFTLEIPIPQE